ncbi:hypothetical protein M3147_10220 [Agromyces mediolanus]|uniref:hypothetical protein n=1 Tax=Agromyces mediolanus TaxID=41986 RepID=UPI002040B959|nr:hypothetical protein [Agromyces mediolanus]MCM3657625.1 hypothetical protein [Agromyces mediolanus]
MLIAGVLTSVLGAVLIVLIPAVADRAAIGATTGGQDVRVAIEFGVRVLRELAPPIGAALVGAAVVMGFVQGRSDLEPR